MTSAIINCPKCKSLILSDTLQCPSCNHVLNEEAAEVMKANENISIFKTKSVNEQTCKDCGVSNRASVVRCWNCGAFMLENIEQTFRSRQSNPQEVILSDVNSGVKPTNSSEIPKTTQESDEFDTYDPEADFELSSELELQDTTDDDFNLADGTEWSYPTEESSSGEYEIPADLDAEYAGEQASSNVEIQNETEPESEEDVDPEMYDFLKMVIREDAAAFARNSRKNKTKSKKIAKIIQSFLGGFVLLPPCKCCKVKIRNIDLGKVLACPKCKVNYQSPEPSLSRTRTIEGNQNELLANKSKLKSFNPKTIALTKTESKYPFWLEFLQLHEYIPEKTKNKPGILEKSFLPVDIAFSEDNLLIIEYAKKPGAYSRDDKKIIKLRETIREMLVANTKPETTKEYEITELPVGWLSTLKILYPAKGNDKNSLPFAGVPIFGEGQIAIKFPANQAGDYTISMNLSQYRSFVYCCLEKYGYIRFTEESPLSLELTTENLACAISKAEFTLLNDAEFYLHDHYIKLEKVGGKCESCHAFVSIKGEENEKVRITKLIAESKKKKAPQAMGVAGLAGQVPKLPAKGKCIICGKNFGTKAAYVLAANHFDSAARVTSNPQGEETKIG